MNNIGIPAIVINELKLFAFPDMQSLVHSTRQLRGLLIAVNAEKIVNRNKIITDALQNHTGYADGIGAVLAIRKCGLPSERIPGTELWLEIARAHPTARYYLIGSSQDALELAKQRFAKEFPSAHIVGYRNGYFASDTEREESIQEIASSKPQFVFVAMGSPNQELFMQKVWDTYSDCLLIGLGGSFDIYANKKVRAPKILRENGMEWAYRLMKEPTRYKRQWKLVKFLFMMSAGRFKITKVS